MRAIASKTELEIFDLIARQRRSLKQTLRRGRVWSWSFVEFKWCIRKAHRCEASCDFQWHRKKGTQLILCRLLIIVIVIH